MAAEMETGVLDSIKINPVDVEDYVLTLNKEEVSDEDRAVAAYFLRLGESAPEPRRETEYEIINGHEYYTLSNVKGWLATVETPQPGHGYKVVTQADIANANSKELDELLAFPGAQESYFEILDEDEDDLIAEVGPDEAARLSDPAEGEPE